MNMHRRTCCSALAAGSLDVIELAFCLTLATVLIVAIFLGALAAIWDASWRPVPYPAIT